MHNVRVRSSSSAALPEVDQVQEVPANVLYSTVLHCTVQVEEVPANVAILYCTVQVEEVPANVASISRLADTQPPVMSLYYQQEDNQVTPYMLYLSRKRQNCGTK